MLERRKVYIEFTGRTSVLFVTPYRSKEIQIGPNDHYRVLDLVTLKNPVPGEPLNFRAVIIDETDEENGKTPDYAVMVYVCSGIDQNGNKRYSDVGVVRISPAENKQKFEVSFNA